MIVDLFIPCFIDQVYPQTGFNVIKILEKIGVTVNYNPKQTCCGQPSFNAGYWKETKSLAKKFIKDFPNDRPIISPSASCTAFIKNNYKELFKDSKLIDECIRIEKSIYEFTDFLVNYMNIVNIDAVFNAKVTYHSSCASLREYGLKNEPILLLNNVKGLELIEMEDSDVCCGFGGTFSVKNEAISTAMAEQKIQNAIKTGAEYIVSTDSSCLLHQEGYIVKHNIPIKIIHIADILASQV
ncbi:MAG: (Fe-S)-binding protein [Bacteroidales bacterium]|nr:(Fe-S)-binding protein [Bacteroidales bacterium]